jgi:glycosyltransferase involved in cell wall biosynthesis
MATIVMTDDGICFDGNSLDEGPLGGAETAFISLAQALAARGHDVQVRNQCREAMTRDGIGWSPLDGGLPEKCDLYIANRSDKLLPLLPGARRAVFWIHNPAHYLLKFRYLWKLWRRRPPIVFSGAYHAATYPAWAPDGGRLIIPYGISDVFRTVTRDETVPAPRAVFTSNPTRGLDWLLDLWRDQIHPVCPAAQLHLFSGPATYGSFGVARATEMQRVLSKAEALAGAGVVLRDPVAKEALAAELTQARVLLYQGDPGETFCLAVGEAQAAGVPCVVKSIGCVAERIVDGKTGFVASDDDAFVASAVKLLSDNPLWQSQSKAALAMQRGWSWDDAAQRFEELLV